MKFLIYGSQGWIGQQLTQLLITMSSGTGGDYQIQTGQSRADDYTTTFQEVEKSGCDRVICALGRTHGEGITTIDYLEPDNKLPLNLRDNLQAPLNLAMITNQLGIHMTYIGTGCIFESDYTNLNGFNEWSKPNFTGSKYSTVKGVTDQIITNFPNVLNARIRMPIYADMNSRNFITKIINYPRIVSIPNSMSVMPELLPILIDMSVQKQTGTINLTNPGVISHKDILNMYRDLVNPDFIMPEFITEEELAKYIVGRRSNNKLDTTKLQTLYPNVNSIHDAVKTILIEMKRNTP
jgi:3,5-epimerase/4-reductase